MPETKPEVIPAADWAGGVCYGIRSERGYLRPEDKGSALLVETRVPYTYACRENAEAALERHWQARTAADAGKGEQDMKQVVIRVDGGVATIAHVSEGVEVAIVDLDDAEAEGVDGERRLRYWIGRARRDEKPPRSLVIAVAPQRRKRR